jgi:peptide/nickel transport system substrate-binding protein
LTSPFVPGGVEQARYFARVLRSIGYRPTLRALGGDEYFPSVFDRRTRAHSGPLIWFADFPSSGSFIQSNFSCGAIGPTSETTSQASFFCDRGVERAIARALRVQVVDPPAAANLWAALDRRIANAAPWVPLYTPYAADFVSRRVGNYQYNPQWGVLVDQLWVR